MRAQQGLVGLLLAAAACGGEPPSFHQVPPAPRRMTVWLDRDGVDAATAERLQRVGVDEVVVRRGSLDLRGGAPVLRIVDQPPVEGPIPLGVVLEVVGVRPGLDRAAAESVWRALERELEGSTPAELVLDLPLLADGLDDFLLELREVSGLAVVPLLSFEQLQEKRGRAVAAALGGCVVPAFGTDGGELRGIGELDPLPLAQKLAPVAGDAVRVRIAIALDPRTQPELASSSDDLDPLTENGATEVSTASVLDRTFNFERSVRWNGRDWSAGDDLAVRWMDASRLRAALAESEHLVLPELGGWDLVRLPTADRALGLGRETLIRYLGGEGPEPELEVGVRRRGRSLRVTVANRSPFATAVSNHGNWVQLSVEEGWVTVDGTGTCERLSRGTLRNGELEQGSFERADTIRFFEIYLAPGEEITTGTVQVPSSRTAVNVSWHFSLFDGHEVTGETSG